MAPKLRRAKGPAVLTKRIVVANYAERPKVARYRSWGWAAFAKAPARQGPGTLTKRIVVTNRAER